MWNIRWLKGYLHGDDWGGGRGGGKTTKNKKRIKKEKEFFKRLPLWGGRLESP